jgi:hypothetical protein
MFLLKVSQFERDVDFHRSLAVPESDGDDDDGFGSGPTMTFEGEGSFQLSSHYHDVVDDELEDGVKDDWEDELVNDSDGDFDDDSIEDLKDDLDDDATFDNPPPDPFVIITSGPIGPPGGWTYRTVTFKHYTVTFGIAHFLRDNSLFPRPSTAAGRTATSCNFQWIEESFD